MRKRAEELPWTPDPHRGGQCVTRWLAANGYPCVSTLKFRWVYSDDRAERDEIRELLRVAMDSTLHMWA